MVVATSKKRRGEIELKREFLKELGLEDEAINKIMAEHGKTVEGSKSKLETFKSENEALKSQIEGTQSKLKEFESMDIDGIKKATEELKVKYESDTKALSEKLSKQSYEFSAKEYLNNYKYANELTQKAVYNEFMSKEFKLEDGKFLGADEFLKGLQESQPTAFITDTKNEPTKPSFGTKTGDSETKKTSEQTFGEDFERAVLGTQYNQLQKE